MIPITFELRLIRSVNACSKHHWQMGMCTLLYSSQNGVEVTFQNSHSNLRNLYHFSVYFFDFVYCACMHSFVCVWMCACIHANVCMYSCACICVCTCVCMWMYLCASVVYTPLCVHACVCVDTQSLVASCCSWPADPLPPAKRWDYRHVSECLGSLISCFFFNVNI